MPAAIVRTKTHKVWLVVGPRLEPDELVGLCISGGGVLQRVQFSPVWQVQPLPQDSQMTQDAEAALVQFNFEKAAKKQAEIRAEMASAQAAVEQELVEKAYLMSLEVGEFVRVPHRNNMVLAQIVDRRNDKVYIRKYIRTRNCWLKPRQLYRSEAGERVSVETAENFCFRGGRLSQPVEVLDSDED